MRIFNHSRTTIFTFILLCALPGCFKAYYQANTITRRSAYPAVIEQAKKDKRYFILQSGINIYSITSSEIDKAKQHIIVHLDKVDSLHLVYLKNPETKPKVQPPLPSEILLYMVDSTSYTLDEPHTIQLNKVARIELVD